MANEFFADPVPFSGRMHASFGGLALILRNGVVDRMITPGRRFSRAWRAPLSGDLSFIEVFTGDRSFGLAYADLATSDGFHIGLALDVVVRVNDAGGFGYLETFIQQHGADFSAAIIQELDNGLRSVVAGTVHRRSHGELRLHGVDPAMLGQLPMAFGTRVLQLVSLAITEITWDDVALEAERIEKTRSVDLAQAQSDEARLTERMILLRPLAEHLGIPLTLLVDKELHTEQQKAALEVFQALPESVKRQLVRQDADIVYRLMGEKPPITPPQRHPGGGPAILASDGTTRQLPVGEDADALTEIIIDAEPAIDLTKAPKLARRWSKRTDESLAGISGAVDETRATVLVVTSATEVPGGFVQDMTDFYGKKTTVRMLPPGGLNDIVSSWFRQVVDTPDDLSVLATLGDDDRITVEIIGSALAARDIKNRLVQPGNPDTEALDELLLSDGLFISAHPE